MKLKIYNHHRHLIPKSVFSPEAKAVEIHCLDARWSEEAKVRIHTKPDLMKQDLISKYDLVSCYKVGSTLICDATLADDMFMTFGKEDITTVVVGTTKSEYELGGKIKMFETNGINYIYLSVGIHDLEVNFENN